MTTDADMKIDYSVVLKQLQGELAGLDGRRQALLASIAAISRLVDPDDEQQAAPSTTLAFNARGLAAEVRKPVVPPGFFSGKSPTEAYRLLQTHWPGKYAPPEIADLFMEGGMAATTRTGLIQAIHSVLKRDRAKQDREQRHGARSLLDMVNDSE